MAVHTLQEGKKSGRSNAVHQRRHRYESAFVFLSMAQGQFESFGFWIFKIGLGH